MSTLSRLDQIKSILADLNQPAFRLQQILTAIYQENILDYQKMSNLPLILRNTLKAKLGTVLFLKKIKQSEGAIAKKILLETRDGAQIESVMTKKDPFVCVSSESGCNLGCRFCSTGTMGLRKKLTADEITDQVLYFKVYDQFQGHLTFMGMGEPLMNPDNVFAAIRIFTDKNCFGYSDRKISLSTVGIIPEIKRFTKLFPQINLAFSLHSPFDNQRSELMPVNKLYPLKQVMSVLTEHLKLTKRKIFIAYLLLNNVNDSPEHSQALVKLIKSQGRLNYLYHVNLIQFHTYKERFEFQRSSPEKLRAFGQILTANHVDFTVRKSFGEDIQAACGQLCLGK
ncbi:MAG: radical SAM protein [Candidatus Beckwithbacteria bacterium]|nr:radical SAM protein [Candidatus Beckwithbacteria bacterium]